uniref:Uncharacterized protein n=1 Tax=Nicotiana tabacum TaxID=4097 RepID=A0A1S3Y5J8_TOBAC|nr:PREDICTED: uncharacterized protein LOC107772547 [Nicotiana tabacum]
MQLVLESDEPHGLWLSDCSIIHIGAHKCQFILVICCFSRIMKTETFFFGQGIDNLFRDDKMGTNELKEALIFLCKGELWRMAVLWTPSLIISYLHLFSQSLFLRKSKFYDRSSPSLPTTSSNPAIASIRKPICIITGATSGLGAAAAFALAKEGYYIVLGGLLDACFLDMIFKKK